MHFTTPKFWERFYALSEDTQNLARKNFKLLKDNPKHPSLHFKKVGDFWSVRIGRRYRALAIEEDGNFTWVWIGSHADYDKLIG